MPATIPFEAVLFDLDGTLVATDRFWPQAARAGAIRAFEELRLERELPSTSDWMSMVGLPLDEGFDAVFADLDPEQRAHVMRRCVEVEHEYLGRGHAAYLPGVEATLAALQEQGKRLGIASNCGREYLSAMMDGLGLSRWIEEGRCLDSRGIRNKADMVQDLLETFGTRRAVMVGDRVGDRDAAWANGLPHVHLARGYARSGEEVPCEARIDGFDALLPKLEHRGAELERYIERLALMDAGTTVLGIGGWPAAGKTLMAAELAEAVERRGRTCEVRAPGGEPLPGGALLLVDGATAGDLQGTGARGLWLQADEKQLLRRIEGRDGRISGPGPGRQAREKTLPEAAAMARGAGPESGSWDLVLDTSNLLEPRLVP